MPQTIQIFLPQGEPTGIRIAGITTQIVRIIEFPRNKLKDFLQMEESGQVGIYFLVGIDEVGEKHLYIGQTGDLGKRLTQHNQNKDFWTRAFVVVSLTHSFTQTHALYLEWKSIELANKAERYILENGNAGSEPHTPVPLRADCDTLHKTIATLLSTLGQPIFEALQVKTPITSQPTVESALFYCEGPNAKGIGYYDNEGMVVLDGSLIRKEHVKSFRDNSILELRKKLIQNNELIEDSDNQKSYRLSKPQIFSSPSTAASFILASRVNGWITWKNQKGQTLDAVYRQSEKSSK